MLHAGLEEYIRNNLAGNGDSCRQRRLGRWAAGNGGTGREDGSYAFRAVPAQAH